MEGFTATDILILLGIGQGLFLSITLTILHNKNVAANRVLSLQLFLSCLILLTRMLLHESDDIGLVQRLAPLESLVFVLGPLGYIYLKRLLEQGQAQFRLPIFHYFPATIYVVFLLYINVISEEVFLQKLIEGHLNAPFLLAELCALLFNITYWVLGIVFFLKVYKKDKEQLSFEQSALRFVSVLLFCSGLVLIAWLVGFIGQNIYQVHVPFFNYELVWVAIPVLIYIVGFFAVKHPELFRVTITQEPKAKMRRMMNEIEENLLKEKMKYLMEEEKVFLDNELTLVHLSEKMNTSTNNVSWLLNSVYKSNFYDFINGYRIEAFLCKVKQEEHKTKTLLSMSMEVGFNSKSTFKKAFNSALYETPTSYIKRLALAG